MKENESNSPLFTSRKVDPKEVMQFLLKQGLLKVVKLYCDWLRTDPETIKACCKSSKTLLGKLVVFLNVVAVDEDLYGKGKP